MRFKAVSEKGPVRQINEDCFLARPERGLFAVADGMGGHEAGEVASQMAIKVLDRILHWPVNDPLKELNRAFLTANRLIYEESHHNSRRSGMGTTMTAALVTINRYYIAHVGDCRAYLFYPGGYRLLTEDHSFVAELIRHGELTEAEAQLHPQRNLLTRAVGTSPAMDVDLLAGDFQPGDYLLLCSDGLTKHLTPEEMLFVLQNVPELEDKAEKMVTLALERGGRDNMTLVLIGD